VLAERIRHAGRRFRNLARLTAFVPRFDCHDTALDLPDVLQIALHTTAVLRSQLPAERCDASGDYVENALVRPPPSHPILRGGAGPEQLLEGDPRIANDRKGLGRRGPAERVGVHAGVPVRAATGLVDVLDAELHRGN